MWSSSFKLLTYQENLAVDSEGLDHGSLRWKHFRLLKITGTLARSVRLDDKGKVK
jgi:hypothetical protein